jgi:hypothetical protein
MNRRVLLIGSFSVGALERSFADAFVRLGFEVFRFDSERAYYESGQFSGRRWVRRTLRPMLWNRMNRTAIEVARTVQPTLAIVVKGVFLHSETVRTIRKEIGGPFINYYPDNPYCGVPWNPRKTSAQRRDLVDVLRQYTRVYIWGKHLADRLANDGVASGFLPFGADPTLRPAPGASPPCGECGKQHMVVFVGQHSDKREHHIAAIRRHSVSLWGNRWSRLTPEVQQRHVVHKQPLFGLAVSDVYARAAVCLNVIDDLNMPGHNMRTFEVPASGGVMLAQYTAEQAEFFPEDVAAAYYRTREELDDKLDRLVSDAEYRERLRYNAVVRAGEHTYDKRVRSMLADLGAL